MHDHASRCLPRAGLARVVLLTLLMMHGTATVAQARQTRDRTEPVSPGVRLAVHPLGEEFARDQLNNPRVLEARLQMRYGIKRLFRDRGITYPAEQIFLRVFKRERVVELWVRPADSDRFMLLKHYMVCALRGALGPKRYQGDNQTPEGFYTIDHFNPYSEFHLSLHVDYPNASDQVLGAPGFLGGDIFIHGGCETAGCIALTDEAIKELYWISVEARAAGQRRIPVHIFPARLTDEELGFLSTSFADQPRLVTFWTALKPGYDYFERTRQLPPIGVDANGRYFLRGGAND